MAPKDASARLDLLEPADRATAEGVLEAAARIFTAARAARTGHEISLDAERASMVRDAAGKSAVTELLDRAFRSRNRPVAARRVAEIVSRAGIPAFMKGWERAGLRLAALTARLLPWIVVPAIELVMRRKTADVILDGAPARLRRHMKARTGAGVRLNINRLGEMILGEREADEKLQEDIALLADPGIDCISVKASNLYSQIGAMAHDRSVAMLAERLRPRLRAARAHRRAGFDVAVAAGGVPSWDLGYKLVNLDMEEYRDLAITMEAFMCVLDEPEFLDLHAGLALQAYLPDSYGCAERLLAFARARVAHGGAPIRIRVVKGANRAMERVESSVRGWFVPTYDDKADTDANWKTMIELICRPENAVACHLGIASHNVFDIVWAAQLIRGRGVTGNCVFEMLEGMADHLRREVARELGDVLLYAPAVAPGKFLTAIAYLVRRFDELTDPANFLSHAFDTVPGSPEWNGQATAFVESLRRMRTVSHERHRLQNRMTEHASMEPVPALTAFRNEPDTDFTAAANRAWLEDVRLRLDDMTSAPETIRLPDVAQVSGTIPEALDEIGDASEPERLVARVELANAEQAERVLVRAASSEAAAAWTNRPAEERDRILAAAAAAMARRRSDLLAYAAADVGKTFDQADGEVSEAVDFGRLYPLAARDFRTSMPWLRSGPLGSGVVMVISPWNFPIAIPAGGVFAALAAGNRVILKPSSESRFVTHKMAECFWSAGVPRAALQVLHCANSVAGRLAADDRVAGIIFTGGTATADRILKSRPGVALFAETGGKNATIITGSSDRELAIKHLADSFRNDGQKCSVTSLVLVTPDVYGDKVFWAQLKDAVASLPVGSAWDPASVITPLVRAPGDELRRGLTVLEPGEEWVLEPRRVDGRDDFWTPGIKRGSRRGSFTHLTELFGPVMTVMRVRDLDDALAAIRETGYGLTLGIETLDDAEARHVVERAPVGVIYVRRSTVGAIAGRQSFGGWRDSRRGPGFHAGGINYVTNLMSFKENGEPPVGSVTPDELLASYAGLQADAAPSVSADAVVADALKLLAAAERLNVDPAWRRASIGIRSAAEQWVRHFSRDHRPSQDVRGEDNVHRYRPLGRVVIRLSGSASSQDGLIMLAAARLAGNDVEVSHASGSSVAVLMKKICPEISTLSGVHWTEEDATLASLRLVVSQEHVMLRYADPAQVEKPLLLAAAEHPRIFISSLPPLMTGRIELLRYVQEQTVSDTYHRYGGDLRAKDAH